MFQKNQTKYWKDHKYEEIETEINCTDISADRQLRTDLGALHNKQCAVQVHMRTSPHRLQCPLFCTFVSLAQPCIPQLRDPHLHIHLVAQTVSPRGQADILSKQEQGSKEANSGRSVSQTGFQCILSGDMNGWIQRSTNTFAGSSRSDENHDDLMSQELTSGGGCAEMR